MTKGIHTGFVPTSTSSWVNVHVKYTGHALSMHSHVHEPQGLSISGLAAPAANFFESSVSSRSSLTERHPRLTIAAAAFALVAFIVIAEIEYLHSAGYYWGG